MKWSFGLFGPYWCGKQGYKPFLHLAHFWWKIWRSRNSSMILFLKKSSYCISSLLTSSHLRSISKNFALNLPQWSRPVLCSSWIFFVFALWILKHPTADVKTLELSTLNSCIIPSPMYNCTMYMLEKQLYIEHELVHTTLSQEACTCNSLCFAICYHWS